MLGAGKLQGVPPLKQQRILFFGAGQSSIGGSRLLAKALQAEGVSEAGAKSQIWLFDSQVLSRPPGHLQPQFVKPAWTFMLDY